MDRRINLSRWATLAVSAAAAMLSRPAAAEDLKPFTEKLPGDLAEFDMLPVPGGEVEVKDPAKPGATVKVKVKPFWMSKTALTWDCFDVFVFRLDLSDKDVAAGADAANRPSLPYVPPDRGFGHGGFSAISLSFLSVTKYCEWLTKKTKHKYRVPTEAEWQWVCQAGAPAKQLSAEELAKVAWYADNSDGKPHEVGQLAANAWGFLDMLGNVRQYCLGLDGKPVACGGGFSDPLAGTQCDSRYYYTPDWQHTDPQNPKSKWWLSDAPWAGARVLRDPD
jgi:formylglycine-generating enzyme required for sulfatase activity